MTNERLEAKIGFDKIRALIAAHCQTDYALERLAAEKFSADSTEIRRRLTRTDEMRLIVMFEESFPLTGYIDAEALLAPLRKEGYSLDVAGLGKLGTMLELAKRVSAFFASVKDSVYPSLKRFCTPVSSPVDIRKRIEEIIDRYGEIKDSASPELERIRRELRAKENSLAKTAGSILAAAKKDSLCDPEAQVTVRDGKFLIPVNTSEKRRLAGFVYDVSATGKTTFIEPVEIIRLENEISSLRFEQAREISRILYSFSEYIRPSVPELLRTARILGELDFLIAKAQTALDFAAGMPVISNEGEVSLRKARHPLLEKALKAEGGQICPLTVTLTPEKRILMISGPNAGGKSVCLKTVGLLQYMFQWGMLIPTSESSELMVFERILVSIGDDQNLESDLSTYSSFLSDMREVVSTADDKTLVLIDEFGSGTEPAAGGAIAEAILARLDEAGAYGVITTHYTNLKLYASGPDTHVINGAMLYDTSRIAPMFKLEIGVPGNSFAFELARKMQLPEDLVKDAEKRAGEEFVDIERNLRRIARGRRVLDEKIQRVQHKDKSLDELTERYEKELLDIQLRRKEILESAKKEAEDIVRGAGAQVEKTIRDIKEAQAEKGRTKDARAELQGFVAALEQKKTREDHIERKLSQLQKRHPKQSESISPEEERELKWRSAPLKIGEKVRVKSNGMVGEVRGVSPKWVNVAIGNISSKLAPERVERISSNEYKEAAKKAFTPVYRKEDEGLRERRLTFNPEIDIRGERLENAMNIVTRYIDDALMLGMGSVRIIHGKGTGVLREEIQKYLRTVPGVASANDEDIRLGGSGVTIVTFD